MSSVFNLGPGAGPVANAYGLSMFSNFDLSSAGITDLWGVQMQGLFAGGTGSAKAENYFAFGSQTQPTNSITTNPFTFWSGDIS